MTVSGQTTQETTTAASLEPATVELWLEPCGRPAGTLHPALTPSWPTVSPQHRLLGQLTDIEQMAAAMIPIGEQLLLSYVSIGTRQLLLHTHCIVSSFHSSAAHQTFRFFSQIVAVLHFNDKIENTKSER